MHFIPDPWVGTCLHPGVPKDQTSDYINQDQTNDYINQTFKVLPDSARAEQERKRPVNGFSISLWIAGLMEGK